MFAKASPLLKSPKFPVGTATAGTTQTQAGATLIEKGITVVTVGTSGDGVRLPATGDATMADSEVGVMVLIINTHATNTLEIYPATGGTINGGAANAGYTVPGVAMILLVATGEDTWYAIEPTLATA